jgi:hypothetical protein
MQITADGLAWTMQTTIEQKVGQAMQTRANGLAWTMQTRVEQKVGQAMQTRADCLCRLETEGWTGHADQSRRFMQTRTRRLDRPRRTEQTVYAD